MGLAGILDGLSAGTLSLILFGLMLIGILSGLHVSFVLAASATVFLYLLMGPPGLALVYLRVWKVTTMFVLAAIPMFVFMGVMLERSGIAEELFDAIYKWFGGLRGGLAMGTIVICAIFAACTGILGAALVTMAYIALPAMLNKNYKKDLALGAVTGGSVLGPTIPPSVPLITMGLFGMTSIGGLFAAGLGAGIVVAIFMIIIIAVRCYLLPGGEELGPPIPKEERASWGEKFKSLRGLILPGILIIAVLGSIFSGIATPTEAAGVGAFGAVVCAVIHRRLTWTVWKEATIRTFRTTGMVMWIVLGAYAFSGAFGLCGGAQLVIDTLGGLGGHMPFLLILAVTIVLGFFMPIGALCMITAPIIFPVCDAVGVSRFWFGAVWLLARETAPISPPFGFCLFYMRGLLPDVAPGATMGNVYKSVFPYIIALVLGIVVIWVFPPIATWLPGLMGLERAVAGA